MKKFLHYLRELKQIENYLIDHIIRFLHYLRELKHIKAYQLAANHSSFLHYLRELKHFVGLVKCLCKFWSLHYYEKLNLVAVCYLSDLSEQSADYQ